MSTSNFSRSIDACAMHYGEEAEAVKAYLNQGLQRALELDNRGPIGFDGDGKLSKDILEAYSRYGFYVFESAISPEELVDIQADMDELRDRFPVTRGANVDRLGRKALGVDCKGPGLRWSKPLSDPFGGTSISNGRHQVKLKELAASEDAPDDAPFILSGSLQFSDAALRIYAHPLLLRVAEAINGEDFAPFNEVLFIKDPGLGAAVSWHQDGDTHWAHEAFDEGIHGFNFMAQVYGSTPVNGVWAVPGTHKLGKINIKAMVEEAGSERLTDAVPLVCEAGDVVICNRQLVHGSFANAGFEPRLTINFGFHRRSSVLNVKGAGIHSPAQVYTDEIIRKRSRVIGYAIDARQQKYPDERPFEYKPFVQRNETFRWNDSAREDLKDYNLLDLSI